MEMLHTYLQIFYSLPTLVQIPIALGAGYTGWKGFQVVRFTYRVGKKVARPFIHLAKWFYSLGADKPKTNPPQKDIHYSNKAHKYYQQGAVLSPDYFYSQIPQENLKYIYNDYKIENLKNSYSNLKEKEAIPNPRFSPDPSIRKDMAYNDRLRRLDMAWARVDPNPSVRYQALRDDLDTMRDLAWAKTDPDPYLRSLATLTEASRDSSLTKPNTTEDIPNKKKIVPEDSALNLSCAGTDINNLPKNLLQIRSGGEFGGKAIFLANHLGSDPVEWKVIKEEKRDYQILVPVKVKEA